LPLTRGNNYEHYDNFYVLCLLRNGTLGHLHEHLHVVQLLELIQLLLLTTAIPRAAETVWGMVFEHP
jgi:hypothetical protein